MPAVYHLAEALQDMHACRQCAACAEARTHVLVADKLEALIFAVLCA